MNFGKSLKGLFVAPEDDEPQVANDPPARSPAPVIHTSIPKQEPGHTIDITQGQVDDGITKSLTAALTAASKTRAPYNYMQFSDTVNKQLVMIPDELTRYKAALATATAMGVTPQSLIDDTSYYMGILKNEASKFEMVMSTVVKNNVTSKEAQIKGTDDETQKKTEEIKRLTDEINELQSQKGTISNEISQQKAQIEQTQNNFGATLRKSVCNEKRT